MDLQTSKPTNPKDLIGSGKLPLHLWPATASALGSLAMLDGALKYGRSNFRAIGVRASIYYDAALRHITRWFEGENEDPDSGLPHLSHALACLAIIVDAEAAGKLNDDRMVAGGFADQLHELTKHVERLKVKYASKSPKHYTIQDTLIEAGEIIPIDYDEYRQSKLDAAGLPFDEFGARAGCYCFTCIERRQQRETAR